MYRDFQGKFLLKTRNVFKASNLFLWYVKHLSSNMATLKEILPLLRKHGNQRLPIKYSLGIILYMIVCLCESMLAYMFGNVHVCVCV